MNLQAHLSAIKKESIRSQGVELWLLDRKISQSDTIYSGKWVPLNQKAKAALSLMVEQHLAKANTVKDYEYFTTDLESDEVFGLVADGTDYDILKNATSSADTSNQVTEETDFQGVELVCVVVPTNSGKIIRAYSKTPEVFKPRASVLKKVLIWSGGEVTDVVEDRRFRLSAQIHFIGYDGALLAFDKIKFEYGLNLRVGLVKARDSAVDMLAKEGILTKEGALLLKEHIGERKQALSQIARIMKNKKFMDPRWLKKVKELNDEHGFGLVFSGDSLVLDEPNYRTIMYLLEDRRVVSLIEEVLLDADIVHPVKMQS